MSIFDLLFILLFLTSVVIILTAVYAAIRGRWTKSLGTLRVLGICFVVYMGVVFVVAFASPQRIVPMGQARCFDDWCITVRSAERVGAHYDITLRLASDAKRVSQRERGIAVHLIDGQGRRFDPAPDAAAVPFDILLDPGEAVETKRSFTVPPDVRNVGLVVAHEGSMCFPGCFIIGEDANPLHKPTIVPLP